MAKKRKQESKKPEEQREPFPDEDREDSEAFGYESSAEMDLEDEEAEEDN